MKLRVLLIFSILISLPSLAQVVGGTGDDMDQVVDIGPCKEKAKLVVYEVYKFSPMKADKRIEVLKAKSITEEYKKEVEDYLTYQAVVFQYAAKSEIDASAELSELCQNYFKTKDRNAPKPRENLITAMLNYRNVMKEKECSSQDLGLDVNQIERYLGMLMYLDNKIGTGNH